MGYKIVVNEYSNLSGLNSTKVLVQEYAVIGTKTTKVIVVEDTNIGSSAYNDAKQAAEAAMIAANQATTILANAVQNTGGTMTGDLKLMSPQQLTPDSAVRFDYLDHNLEDLNNEITSIKSTVSLKIDSHGDTMTGVLIAPNVLLSENQGAESNSVVRRDFFDDITDGLSTRIDGISTDLYMVGIDLNSYKISNNNELGNKVEKSGDILTGDLVAPNFLLSGNQGTEPNSVTSKGYVDTELSRKVDVVDNYKEIITPSEIIIFDLSSGVSFFSGVLTSTITSVNIINVENKPNNYQSFSFSLKQGTGANLVSWPSNILWSFGREPVLTFTQGKIDIFQLITYDNGLTWFGSLIIAGA